MLQKFMVIIFFRKCNETYKEPALDKHAVACDNKTFEHDHTHDSILSDSKVFSGFSEILSKEIR
ncbi:MAG: hypothetical protein ACYDGO_10290 [Smithellaceae bacterium]